MAVLGTAPRRVVHARRGGRGMGYHRGLVWKARRVGARARTGWDPVPHAAARLHAALVTQARAARHSWAQWSDRLRGSAEHARRAGGCTLDHYSRVAVWYQAITFLATRSIARHPLPARAIGPARVVAKIGEETRASTTAIGAGRDIAHRSWLRRKREGTSTPLRKVDGLATVEVCLGHGDSIR
jgi:hypothetical protein